MRRLFTFGHSNKSAEEIVATLQALGITRVVDVRRFPASRNQPQFNRELFSKTLSQAGIGYTHLEQLGGRRSKSREVDFAVNAGWEHSAFHNYADYALGDEFQEGLRRLLGFVKKEVCAVMCAEALWWRCHRRIISDYVMAKGIAVFHIFTRTKCEPASMTPFASVGKRGIHYEVGSSKKSRGGSRSSRALSA